MSSFNPSAPSGLMQAVVIGIAPPNHLLVFIPAWGAGTRVQATVLGYGQNDALRTRKVPLPKLGTFGCVGFMHNDSRNCMWLGSFPPALANAFPDLPGDNDVTYESENSGYWHYRDGQGNETTTWADGTSLTVSQTGVAAVPNRNVVEDQKQVAQPLTQAQRATIKGNVTITLATAAGFEIVIAGGIATMTGNLKVIGSIMATGDITAGVGTGDVVDLLLHTHVYVPGSGSPTNTSPPTAGT